MTTAPIEDRNFLSDFVRTELNEVLSIGKVISFHYFQYAKEFRGIGESHDFWELVYIDVGQVTIQAENRILPLRQGEAIFHCPGEYHNLFTGEEFASVFIVSFDCFSESFNQFFSGKIVTINKDQQKLISNVITQGQQVFEAPYDIMDQKQLVKKKNTPYGAEQMFKTSLEQFLISLVASREESPSVIKDNATLKLYQNESRIIDTVITICRQHIRSDVSLSYICDRLSFSPSYIERIFERKLHCGVKQYFMKLKIDEAKRMISEGTDNFTEISTNLGFSSLHYFSRAFKKQTGMSPTQYKLSVRSKSLL